MKRLAALVALAALLFVPAIAPAALPADYGMWTSLGGQIRIQRVDVGSFTRMRVEDSSGNISIVALDDGARVDLIMMLVRAAP